MVGPIISEDPRERIVHTARDPHSFNKDNGDRKVFGWLLLGVLAVVILRNAWVTEDAFIMFRTIDNFVAGNGLVWNLSERVQTFTNPLWTLLLSGIDHLGGDLYLSSIFLGAACTVTAAGLIAFRIDRSSAAVIIALPLLIMSKAFIDFATSGLENPMSFLAIALFHVVYFSAHKRAPGRQLFLLSLFVSIAVLNRMDLALLFIPALVHHVLLLRGWKYAGAIAMGSIPFVCWLFFSVFYYGTPFPNTAYAKLNTGVPIEDRIEQGWYYLLNSFTLDPVTLPVIVLGIVLLMLTGGWRGRMLSLGVILYLIYTVRVGGDFMSGRFLSAPFFATVTGLVAILPGRLHGRQPFAIAAVVVLIGLLSPYNPVSSGKDYHRPMELAVDRNGIADERAVFFANMGFLHMNKVEFPDHGWVRDAKNASRNIENERVLVHANIGLLGYYAHPELHILDMAALADPLLARLPAPPNQRIGHHVREVPAGYERSIRTGRNEIIHPSLATFYDALSLVVKAPLWSDGRMREIYRLNTGYYNDLIQDYVDTRHMIVHPLTDLLDRKAFEQHAVGWWGSGGDGSVWGMGWQNELLFDINEERLDTLTFKATSPFPGQHVDVLYNMEHLGRFEMSPDDTLRVKLPLHVKPQRNSLTFQFGRWNSEGDHYVHWSRDPNAVEFHQLGIK